MRAVHIFDLAAHGAVAVLLVVVARTTLGMDTHVAGGLGLLFATHPVHVEAVCNCTSRAEMLYSVMVLGAWLAFFEADKLLPGAPLHRLAGVPAGGGSSRNGSTSATWTTWLSVPALCIFQGIACASKEQGIFFVCMTTAFLAVQLLVLARSSKAAASEIEFRRRGASDGDDDDDDGDDGTTPMSNSCSCCSVLRTVTVVHFALWACTFANILWRGHVSKSRLLPAYSYTMNPIPYMNSTKSKLLTAFSYHAEAFRLMLLPTWQPMKCDYKDLVPVVDVDDPRNFRVVLLYLGLVGLGLTLARRLWVHSALEQASPTPPKSDQASMHDIDRHQVTHQHQQHQHQQSRSLTLAAVFFFGVLVTFYLPSSNAIGYVGFYVAERVLYLPSAGVIGLACLALHGGIRILLGVSSSSSSSSKVFVSNAIFWAVVLIITAAFALATMERVPAWTSTCVSCLLSLSLNVCVPTDSSNALSHCLSRCHVRVTANVRARGLK